MNRVVERSENRDRGWKKKRRKKNLPAKSWSTKPRGEQDEEVHYRHQWQGWLEMNLQGRHRYNRHKEKVGKRLEGTAMKGTLKRSLPAARMGVAKQEILEKGCLMG